MRKYFIVFIITCLSFFAFSENLVDVEEVVLKNGLKILMVEDHKTPLVVCRLYYKVGSVYETIGKSGISHMLEHMMFKGTKKIGVSDFKKEQSFVSKIDSLFILADMALKANDSVSMKKYKAEGVEVVKTQRKYMKNNEHWGLYQKEGGTALNAYTSNLLTAYIVTLPSNKLELFMWLESDRMANPVMREFYMERDVVMEERRLRYENSPYGRYYESLRSMLYEAHPFRIPTIGYMSDLHHLTRQDAFTHFKKYYVPNNAVMVFVGDINKDSVIALSKRYFGPVKAGNTVKDIVTEDPAQVGLKRLIVEKDVSPVVDIYFKTPSFGHNDIYVLDLIEGVLNGKSGRLYKEIVKKRKLATSVSAGNYISKYCSYFRIHASLIKGVSHKEVEEVILNEISKFKSELISLKELEKVKNKLTLFNVESYRSNEHLADQLAYYEVFGSWKHLNTFADNVKKVKRKEVLAVAKKYFVNNNSVIGYLKNSKKEVN